MTSSEAADRVRHHEEARVGRVPPHNLEAEESLLGAMLLSKDVSLTRFGGQG
jgi:hypothetical protein